MREAIALIVFVSFPGWIAIFKSILNNSYLWQVKEYRIDRIWSHFRFQEGKSKMGSRLFWSKILILLLTIIFIIRPTLSFLIVAPFIAFAIYLFELKEFQKLSAKKELQRPKVKSIRNILILSASLFIYVIPIILFFSWIIGIGFSDLDAKFEFIPGTIRDISFWSPDAIIDDTVPVDGAISIGAFILSLSIILLIAMELLVPFVVSFWAVITEPLAQGRRYLILKGAREKLKEIEGFKVVAITGSYGKTTTKELTYQLLQSQFSVARTPKNNNTVVGMAQAITSELQAGTQVFVAEMGAYRKGEIKKMTQLLPPDIAIVTALEEQHISLFGSFEKLFAAKYEIVEGLRPDGLAIFNGDNEGTLRMAEKYSGRKQVYFTIDNAVKRDNSEGMQAFPGNKQIFARSVATTEAGISFELVIAEESYAITTNILGVHNVSNLLASVNVAVELGLAGETIAQILNTTKFELPNLEISDGINGSRVINDSANISQAAFNSALKVLDAETGKTKWVVTQGIIELGKSKGRVYSELAEQICKYGDVLVTSDLSLATIVRKHDPEMQVSYVESPFGIGEILNKGVSAEDLVLVEGRIPAKVAELVFKNNDN